MPDPGPRPLEARHPPHRLQILGVIAGIAGLIAAAAPPRVWGQDVAPATAGEAKASVQRLTKLQTSDQVPLAAWYYPVTVEKDAPPPPVAILIHDLGGSHESIDPLARDLQSRGIAVVAPDLRGHGASADTNADHKSLKKSDFEHMAMTSGGRVRDQAANRGDVETLWQWIQEQSATGKLDMTRLVIVGTGVGAAVAAHWTANDATWPDLASGPQGRHVRGLVLVSPAWTTRGFSISPALGHAAVRRGMPVLLIGGAEDGDAVKLYDQLKRLRPDEWSEKRAGQAAPTQAVKLAKDGRPTLYLRQLDTSMTGERLAAYVPKDARGGGYPGAIIAAFVDSVTAEAR